MATAEPTAKAGWEVKTLGEVCEVIGGGTPSKNKPEFYEGDIPWATVRDLNCEIVTQTEHKITQTAVQESSTNIIPADNVILVTRVGLGKVCLIGQDTAINQDLRGIIPRDSEKLSVRFLFGWLKSIAHLIEAEGTGATVKGVKLPFVKGLTVPLPPLAEQERIVGILDEAFEGIAAATAQAEKNLHNARELFQSVLQSTFSQKGDDWVETTLGEVCGFQNGFAFKSAKFRESGVPILRISNIQDDQIDTRKIVFTDPSDYREDLDRYQVVKDDLLIAMSGATTGKIGFNTTDTIFLLNQRVGKFEPSGSLEKRFLYFYLLTKVEENLRISAGAAQPNLSTEQIKGFQIPLPQVPQQQSIVKKLDALSEETKRLEAIYERKKAALTELKQSLLKKAFAGEL